MSHSGLWCNLLAAFMSPKLQALYLSQVDPMLNLIKRMQMKHRAEESKAQRVEALNRIRQRVADKQLAISRHRPGTKILARAQKQLVRLEKTEKAAGEAVRRAGRVVMKRGTLLTKMKKKEKLTSLFDPLPPHSLQVRQLNTRVSFAD
jgi:hypothetical protein